MNLIHLQMKVLDKIPAFIGKDRLYYMIYDEDSKMYSVEVKTQDDFMLTRNLK